MEEGREYEEKRKVRFDLGRVVITANAMQRLDDNSVRQGLGRHSQGDWGDLSDEDRQANDRALKESTRLLSAYQDSRGTKYWIITEADRSSTTVLLPEDY